MNQNVVSKIGWLGSLLAIIMFSSFIDQIRLNLAGQKGSIVLPVATTINCITWSLYALLKSPRDYPLLLPNGVGIVLGLITTITTLI